MSKNNNSPSKLAHDLRSPISVIKGYLRYRDQENMSAEEREYWNAAKTCAERILKVADHLTEMDTNTTVAAPKITQTQSFIDPDKSVVLVVDDDQDIQCQWKTILQSIQLPYIGIKSGESLLNMSIDYSKVAAAIVDYEFEESSLTGFDVIEYLQRKKVKDIHLCTGLSKNIEIRNMAERHGIDSIISKPIPEDIQQVFAKYPRQGY